MTSYASLKEYDTAELPARQLLKKLGLPYAPREALLTGKVRVRGK